MPKSRVRPHPTRAARGRQDAGPIRHSVGGKEANGQISPVCCISDTASNNRRGV